eukprot:TRINITY_DN30912_c0_g1_i2.p1 TRINITY_DN30912_c0_g1~~TRINITY_DN30912_c0_g1_i2.p1  ORF type:complete len:337 (+),score=65.73 TRINITY_DN30912_c0_g1_i2:593-1603(+)
MGTAVQHRSELLPTGVKIHYAEYGSGDQFVVLCHGWPEFWFSWRHQIKALGNAGYHVVAPDLRGFGETELSSTIDPSDPASYCLEAVCSDLVALLDVLHARSAVFVGHDWGGMVVWAMAQHHAERVRAVTSLNTPFFPPNPKSNPLNGLMAKPGLFDYQLYFQTPGVAESELDRNVAYSLKCLIRSAAPEDRVAFTSRVSLGNVRERGGMLVGFPKDEDLKRSVMFSSDEFEYFVAAFRRSGFVGGISWYRNVERNWRWSCQVVGRNVLQPALMVTAEKDAVLAPSTTRHMENWIPKLSRAHLSCGHWTQQEMPNEVNSILLNWLRGLPSISSAKL